MKNRVLFLFFVCLAFGAAFGLEFQYLSDGFSLKAIQSSELKKENSPPPEPEISSLFSQPFRYLDKGSQCFVFESEDGQYILKFFRFSRFKTFKISPYFFLPSFLRKIEQQREEGKKCELMELFASCRLAAKELKEESGIVYLHLNKTNFLNIDLTLSDKLGRFHTVNLDETAFVLQKKGELLYSYLLKCIKKEEKEEAKKALSNFVQLLYKRLEKEIFDKDVSLAKNMGFRFGKAMFLDIGTFEKTDRYKNKIFVRMEMNKITYKLESWLKHKDPELASYLRQEIEAGF